MNISGSGHLPAGEYNEHISISGSGRLDGNIRCQSLSCAGSAHGKGNLSCSEKLSASGSCHIEGDVSAAVISTSGSLHVGGTVSSTKEIRVSGSVHCKNIQANELRSSGSLKVEEDLSGEKVTIRGKIICGGLLNAEMVDISMDHGGGSEVGSIGGSEIRIYQHGNKKLRMNLFTKLVKTNGCVVRELVEGDLIALENVSAPKVVGRVVAIGEGCSIDLVQYSEEVEIHPNAIVGKCEKI